MTSSEREWLGSLDSLAFWAEMLLDRRDSGELTPEHWQKLREHVERWRAAEQAYFHQQRQESP